MPHIRKRKEVLNKDPNFVIRYSESARVQLHLCGVETFARSRDKDITIEEWLLEPSK